MKFKTLGLLTGALAMGALITGCFQVTGPALSGKAAPARAMGQPGGSGGGGGGEIETAVNNLSFPVVYSDDPMAIGEVPAGVTDPLSGTWVYWAGLDIDGNPIIIDPARTQLDPSNPDYIELDPNWKKAFYQQDAGNVWTANATRWVNVPGVTDPVLDVDQIDWGDNLESQDWSTNSKIRTEVVLFKNLPEGAFLNGYEMLHIAGLGVDEMHGLSVLQETVDTAGTSDAQRAVLLAPPVTQPIVYTNHARLTIQKLNVARDSAEVAALTWDSDAKCWVGPSGYVDAPIVSEFVCSEDDLTTGDYSAEINIKGRVVYGYTWDAGGTDASDYRITFNLDPGSGAVFDDQTGIVPLATEVVATLAAEEEPTVGGSAKVVPASGLTYIDVRLNEGGGGGGGSGHGGGGGGSHGGRA